MTCRLPRRRLAPRHLAPPCRLRGPPPRWQSAASWHAWPSQSASCTWNGATRSAPGSRGSYEPAPVRNIPTKQKKTTTPPGSGENGLVHNRRSIVPGGSRERKKAGKAQHWMRCWCEGEKWNRRILLSNRSSLECRKGKALPPFLFFPLCRASEPIREAEARDSDQWWS